MNDFLRIDKHTLHVCVLLFSILFLKTLSYIFLPFLLVAGFRYFQRFGISDFKVSLPIVAIFLIFSLSFLKVNGKVVWIFERGDSKIALLSERKRIRIGDFVGIGDIVDGNGNLISRSLIPFGKLRYNLALKTEGTFSYPISSVVEALLLGVRYYLPDNFKSYVALSGIFPLLAVSGLHIGILFGILFAVFRSLFGKRKGLIFALCVLTVFIPFTGFSVPSLRGYFFILLVVLGKLLRRNVDYLYITLVIALVFSLFSEISVSFVLSFLGIFGVIYGFSKGLKGKIHSSTFPFLFIFPFAAFYFKTVNIFSPLLIFLVSPFLSIFLFVLFLDAFFLFKFLLLNNIVATFAVYSFKLVKFLFSTFHIGVFYFDIPKWFLFLYLFVIFTLIVFEVRRSVVFVASLGLMFSSFVFIKKVENRNFYVSSKKLNSFYFVTKNLQKYHNCLIYTEFYYPFVKRIAEANGNKLILKEK